MKPRLSLVKLHTSTGKSKKVVLTIEGRGVKDIRSMMTLVAAALRTEKNGG